MATVDKIILNNQIVLMRQDVRRAKLHVINKLVKESKKLKNKFGTEEQKQKYMKKSDRLIDEVKAIKNLKEDDVSKFVLSNQRDVSAILNDAENNIRLKVLAKLSTNNVIRAAIYDFKTKYPNYLDDVCELLPKPSKRHTANKPKLKDSNKKIEQPPKKAVNCSDTILNNSQVQNGQQSIMDTSGTNTFLIESTVVNLKRKNNGADIKKDNKIVSKKEKKKKEILKSEDEKFELNDKNDLPFVSNSGTSLGTENINKHKKSTEKEKKVADPFFMTANNTEYMTVVTRESQIEALTNPTSKSSDVGTEFKNKCFKNKRDINHDSFSNTSFKIKSNNTNSRFNSYHKQERRFENKHPVSNKEEKLHPSWEAKKKFAASNISINSNSNRQERRFESKHPISNKEEKLHPSWEAKKKIAAGSVTQFSGKKIVFGDD